MAIDSFTFGMITYNQEQYVLDHLDSIRYQILKYGAGIDFDLVVGDDCSTDETITVIRNWICIYKDLFRKVTVIKNECNVGITNNYKNVLTRIETNKFKVLAGDDYYYTNNIFDLFDRPENMYVSPLIGQKKDKLDFANLDYFLDLFHRRNRVDIKQYILQRLKEFVFLPAPSFSFTMEVVDKGFYQSIDRYKWIEDIPMLTYLLKKQNLNIFISNKPYIVYRYSVGVSTNTNHPRRHEFEREMYDCLSLYCPYRNDRVKKYTYSIYMIWLKYVVFNTNYEIRELKNRKLLDLNTIKNDVFISKQFRDI